MITLNKAPKGCGIFSKIHYEDGVLMELWGEMRTDDLDAGSLARSTTGMECRWSFGARCDRMT
ncbi:hypothetical protein [Novipirellula sp.]|uniref:hypothetical protein n=1 Tax=Novipirellula sp. TaxID=2795430 RepID=UPI00356A866E